MISLKFIGRTYYGIKKFFTPNKWETVWTCKCKGNYTRNGMIVRDGNFVCVVKLDKFKNAYQAYMTDGTQSEDMDLAYLAGQSTELTDILKRNNINF